MRAIAVKFGVSVSVVFEASGWKDYYEFELNDWEEHAAILKYDGGMERNKAEQRAWKKLYPSLSFAERSKIMWEITIILMIITFLLQI